MKNMELRNKTKMIKLMRKTMVSRKILIRKTMMRTSRSRLKSSPKSNRKNFYYCSSRPLKCKDTK